MTGFGARARLAAGLIGIVALTAAGAAQAQPKPPESRAAPLQRLLDCRRIADNTERLACFDAQAGAIDQAEAKGDIVVVDRDQARTVRRQAFGFTLPSISLFEKGEKPEDLDNVTSTVAAAQANSSGKWVVELADGAVWTQIDTTEVMRRPKPGMSVKVRKASMGSYLLSLDGQRAYRARREQ